MCFRSIGERHFPYLIINTSMFFPVCFQRDTAGCCTDAAQYRESPSGVHSAYHEEVGKREQGAHFLVIHTIQDDHILNNAVHFKRISTV